MVRKVNNSRQIIIGGLLTFTSLEEAMEIRNCLAAIEEGKRRKVKTERKKKKEIEEKEKELKEKEEKLKQKTKEIKNTTLEAKRVHGCPATTYGWAARPFG